jgi:uncharacterized protein
MPSVRRALVIVGKAPRPGHTKTRLAPPLSPVEAADLARAFLLDAVDLGLALNWERVSVVHPAGDGPMLHDLLPPYAHCREQTGMGLGAALSGAFEQHFAAGFDRVVLIDSDSPTLPAGIVGAACDQLEQHDVTIGPSADGGYYLLGLREPRPALFEGVTWSTSTVYQQTLQRAHGLRVADLPEWYDVDGPQDLTRLEADLHQQSPHVAIYTREVMHRLKQHVAG